MVLKYLLGQSDPNFWTNFKKVGKADVVLDDGVTLIFANYYGCPLYTKY